MKIQIEIHTPVGKFKGKALEVTDEEYEEVKSFMDMPKKYVNFELPNNRTLLLPGDIANNSAFVINIIEDADLPF